MNLFYKKCEVCGKDINKLQSWWNIYSLKAGAKLQCPECGTQYKTNKVISFIGSWFIPIMLIVIFSNSFKLNQGSKVWLYTIIVYSVIELMVMVILPLKKIEDKELAEERLELENENFYFRLPKERYLLIILVPVLIISGFFIYAHIYGIIIFNDGAIHNEYGSFSVFEPSDDDIVIEAFFAVLIFFFIQLIRFFISLIKGTWANTVAIVINSVIVFATVAIGLKYSHFTQKIENFKDERQYYLRFLKLNQRIWSNPQHTSIDFDALFRNQKWCNVLYSKEDNYIEHMHSLNQNKNNGKLISEDIVKLEPHFYYKCYVVNDQNSSTKISKKE